MRGKYLLFLILAVSFLLNSLGLKWGVPSRERNQLYFNNEAEIYEPIRNIKSEEVVKSMTSQKKRLAGPLFNPIRSYHPDESKFIKAVSNMDPRRLNFNPHYLYYGTLYIYLLAFALAVSFLPGYIKLTTDILFYFSHPEEIAKFYLVGRTLSVIFAVLTVYLTYCIAKRLYNEKTGLLSALALSTTPILVINAHYVAVDVTMAFFISLTFLMAIKLFASSRLRWYVFSGMCAGAAASTKYNAGLVLLMVPLADLLRTYKRKRALLLCWFKKKVLLSYACAAAVFLILCPFVFLNPAEFKEGLFGGILRVAPRISSVMDNLLFYLKVLYHGMGLPLFLISLMGTALVAFRREKRDMLPLFWVMFTFGILLLFSPLRDRHTRYILIMLPFLTILASRFVEIVGKGRGKIFAVSMILLLFFPSLLYSLGYDRLFMRENIRTTAGRWIARNIPAGSTIGLREDIYQFEVPPLNREKYRLSVTHGDVEILRQQKPVYFIANEVNYGREMLKRKSSSPASLFWRELFQQRDYEIIKEFQVTPRTLGIPYNLRSPSEDYLYIYPRIVIFKRREG